MLLRALGGVRLSRKFKKTARAILYVGHANRIVDYAQPG